MSETDTELVRRGFEAPVNGDLDLIHDLLDPDVPAGENEVAVVMRPRALRGSSAPLRANWTRFRDGRVIEMVADESPEAALGASRT